MTSQDHTPTEREQTLYEALINGDQAAIRTSRNRAQDIDAWQEDYRNAWTRYQRENETSEKQRMKLTAEQTRRENHEALEGM